MLQKSKVAIKSELREKSEFGMGTMSGDTAEEDDGGLLLSLLNITATVTTILMYLTGVTPCREVCTEGEIKVCMSC